MDPYEELGNAVVLQAVKEYRRARKRLAKHPDNFRAERTAREIEAFFRGRWFGLFTGLDGEALLERLREEVMPK